MKLYELVELRERLKLEYDTSKISYELEILKNKLSVTHYDSSDMISFAIFYSILKEEEKKHQQKELLQQ